jgi:hypothetical protein
MHGRCCHPTIRYEDVQQARGGSAVVDLGNIPASIRASCRADYAILTYYDLYLKEADRFPEEIATYRQILAGGRTVALFRPAAGRIGGPTVRIVAVPPQPSRNNFLPR